MDYIYKEQVLNISIDVFRGQSTIKEEFGRADVRAFLVCGADKMRIPIVLNVDTMGTLKGSISNIPDGVYGIKLMWTKNDHRCLMCAEKYQAFGITSYQGEATNPEADEANIKCVLRTATYGYDGLDAYELSVLKGKTTLTEEEWLNNLNNTGKSGSYTTYGKWSISLDVTRLVANPNGDSIPYTAVLSRPKTTIYYDGVTPPLEGVDYETAKIIIDQSKGKADGGNIIVYSNDTSAAREIVVTAQHPTDSSVSVSNTIKQEPTAQITLLSAVDGNNMNVLADKKTMEIVCYDSDFDIEFAATGGTGNVAAEVVSGNVDVYVSGNTIKVEVLANTGTTVVNSRIKLTYSGKEFFISVEQTYNVGNAVYGEATASLNYGKVPASGGNATPVIVFNQSKAQEKSDGKVVNTSAQFKSVSYSGNYVNALNGTVTYNTANYKSGEHFVTEATAAITTEDNKTVTAKSNVYQKAADIKPMLGILKKSISGFTKLTDSLASSITGTMLENSINYPTSKTINEYDGSSMPEVSLTGNTCDYFVGLVPKNISKYNGYTFKVYNGINAYKAIDFSSATDHHANGKEISVNDIPYLMYCLYVSSDNQIKKFKLMQ